jgi:2-phosphosulfolactate phosphatase
MPVLVDEESEWAARHGSVIASHGSAADVFSLSPGSFANAEPGARVVISSANGATCARLAAGAAAVFAAGLENARADSTAVNEELANGGTGVTVVACGERWPEASEEGDLRFALEDYLGAGAVLSGLQLSLSPDAEVCRAAFENARNNLRGLVWNCPSGVELRERGLEEDVHWCCALNSLEVVPRLVEGVFRNDLSLT